MERRNGHAFVIRKVQCGISGNVETTCGSDSSFDPEQGSLDSFNCGRPFFSYRYSVNLAVIRKEHSNSVDRYSRKNRREPITKPNLKSNVAVEGKGQISAFQTQ